MTFAHSYQDLIVYKKARDLGRELFEVSKRFPRDETYSLTDQIRRSSRSIGAQIAEAWAKRVYAKHFVSKLTDADGEHQETQHWIDIARDCGYLNDILAAELSGKCAELGRMLQAMIDKSSAFCPKTSGSVHEQLADYIVLSDLNTEY